jgi:predicted dehydrogenase
VRNTEGVYELHYQRREYGQLTYQLYFRGSDGQLTWVGDDEQAPFESDFQFLHEAWTKLRLDLTRPT